MTRKDYKVLANVFRRLLNDEAITRAGFIRVCCDLDAQFANFNYYLFQNACGFVPTDGELN